MFTAVLFAAFLLLMIFMGIWGMRKTSTLNDFFLGGRAIGPWVSAFAYATTYFSAVLFIGFSGKLGWVFGLNVLWIAAGNVLIGTLLAWLVLGRRTRRMSQNLDAMTMPEFFGERYGSRWMKVFSAVLIFVFLLPYSASVFKGLSHLFEINFNMSYDMALLIMIGVTGIYLVLGGYFAVTLTDFVQGLVMLFGSVAMIALLTGKAGGVGASIAAIAARYPQHVPIGQQPGPIMLISLVFMTSFGPWGLPQMVQKFYSIKDEKMILRAAVITTLFACIVVFAAYFNGALFHAFYDGPVMVDGKPAFDRMVPALLKDHLPEPLMALILLLVLSASMSTLSSLILVSSSAVAIDLYKGQINPHVSRRGSLRMMRVLSAVFIVVSYGIARHEFGVIVTLMSLSWGVVAGAFMAPFLYALYWRRSTAAGAWAGMLSGAVTAVVLFFQLGVEKSPIASSIAMIVPFLVVPAVSGITTPPNTVKVADTFRDVD